MAPKRDVSQLLPEEAEKVAVAVRAAGDKKAENIVVIDVTGCETFTDYIMICHGNSDRHAQAIYEGIEKTLRKRRIRTIGTEGERLCHWILMDFGGLVVHVFYEPLRDYYDIEGLWVGSPLIDIEPLLGGETMPDAETSAEDSWS